MKLRTQYTLWTILLLGGVATSITGLVIRSQRTALEAQTHARLEAVLEGAARVGAESLKNKDRLMLFSYLRFLRREHTELALASVTRGGHTTHVGKETSDLRVLERLVHAKAQPVKYTITAYPEAGGAAGGDLVVSPEGVALKVRGRAEIRVDEKETGPTLTLRLGFVESALRAEVDRALRPLVEKTIAIAAVALGIGLLANFYVGFMVTHPLQALTLAAARLSKGEHGVQVPARGPGEIGDLGRSFNGMATEISRLTRFREDILHTLTHELNTPLNGLKGYLEMWKEGGVPKETAERGDALNTMVAAVVRMEHSLGNALKLFRDAKQEDDSEKSFVWIDELFNDAALLFEPVARSKNVTLHGLTEDKIASVEGDEETLRRIITNLVSNAIKYTASGGEVWFGLENLEHHVHFSVRDSGYGIPDKDLPHLFTKFYRSEEDRSRARRIPGTGLGLNIVHRAVTRLGGRIIVRSKVGTGTVFIVTLPKRAA